MKAAKFSARQGDVLIEAVDEAEMGEQVQRDNGRIVLAYGEVTGHAHAIADTQAEMFESRVTDVDLGVRFLQVLAEGGVALTHEEHGTITIPPGTYKVTRQREYSPEAIRNVAD